MATAKKTQIVITANAATAKKVMDELQQRIDALKQRMAALDVTTSQGQKEFKKLEKELVSYNSAVAQNVTNTERIDKAMKNLAGTSLNELKRALSAAKSELGKMSANSSGLKQMQNNVKAIQSQIDKLNNSVKNHGSAWQTAMKNLTAYVGMFTLFNKAKEMMTGVLKKNFEFSSSLTDIRKVSGMAMEDVNKLATELAKIDTRTSIDGLAQLAYQGAKLGMGKYGVEGMAGFVRAADKINVAIGEEMGKEALPALSKLVEVMGLIPKMGIEKAMDATGSAMFKLSSTSTATSGNIVEFAKRLTGVARTAGITTDQLLALGSASDSMYLMPEVASTAMSKFIVALQRNHNLIEKDLGIQQGTIKNMYAAGNAMDAIVLVLEKMKQTGNMNALGGIFKDLGSDGQRLVTAMVTMSKNVDMLKDHLYESQEAFEEATAVTNEYEMQQQSAAGILERANNLWEKAFVNPDGVNTVKSFAETWYDLSVYILQSPIYNNTLQIALKALLLSFEGVLKILPVIINYFLVFGAMKTASFVFSAGVALKELIKSLWMAVRAQEAFNLASSRNIYTFIAAAVLTAAEAIWSYVKSVEDAANAQEEAERKANAWKDTLSEARIETDKMTTKLYSYKKQLEDANISQQRRHDLLSRFNRDFRSYISNLGIEINSVSDLSRHYKALAKEIESATYYRLRDKAYEQKMGAYQTDRVNALTRVRESFKEIQELGSSYTLNDLKAMIDSGRTAFDVYKQVLVGLGRGIHVSKNGSISYVNTHGVTSIGPGYKEFLSSLRHYKNASAREKKAYNDINAAYAPFISEGYTPYREDKLGTLSNNAVDKKAVAAPKKAERERIAREKKEQRDQVKTWRDELKSQKAQANAIIDNVKNFYNRQINAKQAKANELGLTDVEQKQYLEPIKKRKNEALSELRRAIAGKDNNWDDFKKTIKDRDLIEEADETGINLSEGLLNDILKNNIETLHSKMAELSKNLEIPLSSVLAEVFSNATKNEGDNLKLEAEQLKARRKAAMDHDYIGAVQQSIYEQFNTFGYAEPTEDDLSTKLNHDLYRDYIIRVFETARQNLAILYSIDPSTKNGQGLLMKFLFGDDPTNMGARLEGVLGDDITQWQLFYSKLVQYSDEYTEAQKKMYDEAKKVAEQLWKINRKNLSMQKGQERMQRQGDAFGKRTNYLSNLGLKDLTADPEIQLMKMRMQAAQDYYEFLERHTKNQQLKDEAEKSRQEAELAYAKKLAEAMKERLSQMKSFVVPIEEFGSAVGQAFAEMRDDVDSAHDAIKNALKSMLMSWGKMAIGSFSTQMWKAINDAGVKGTKPKADADIAAGRARAAATAQTAEIMNLGTAENPMYVRIVDGQFVPVGEKGKSVAGNQSTQSSSQSLQQEQDVPAAWRKRNPGKTAEDYRLEVSGATTIASNVGEATADVITGQGSFETVAGSLASGAINTALNTDLSSLKSEKNQKKEQQAEKKHQKELTKVAKSGIKEREKATKKGIDNISVATQEGADAQTNVESVKNEAITAGLNAAMNTQLTAKQANNAEVAQEDATLAEQETTFSMVGAIAKCFEFLGPIAGPIAAATVTATLMGLLQWALSSAFKSKKTSTTGPTAKVKSGMLTYDNGNVQDLKPFVADNGDVYWAREDNVRSGVNLLSTPTATTINGQPSIVAEKGPELVIGRETTKAMMMNNPSLLKALVNYDANYSGRRAYDAGNVADSLGNVNNGANESVINNNTASNAALLQAVSMLLTRLNEPINAQINMYGTGGLYESTRKANQFMVGKNR